VLKQQIEIKYQKKALLQKFTALNFFDCRVSWGNDRNKASDIFSMGAKFFSWPKFYFKTVGVLESLHQQNINIKAFDKEK